MRRVKAAARVPVLAGSGVTDETIGELRTICDGAIVGSWLKAGGDVSAAVDVERVRRLVSAIR